MANLKVFVASTCYDMQAIRAQLKSLLNALGYEPVMSDDADVIFDPRLHTHTSCLREVTNCDMVVLVVGSRFGGATIPKALELIDMDHLSDLSRSDRFGEDKAKISITQAEVVKAIQSGIPVFAFVEAGVLRDHLTYEKNKNKPIINQIEFSSIDKAETAPYIFEFMNFLRLRNENNSIFEFSRLEDIESQLKKQWAGLFQRLLHEQRSKAQEGRRIDNLSSQIADLKAAVLSSISSAELKETAKGTIRFRHIIDFVYSLAAEYRTTEAMDILRSDAPWNELLGSLGIVDIRSDDTGGRVAGGIVLFRSDNTFYRARMSLYGMAKMASQWDEFRKLKVDAKNAIVNAVIDSRDARPVNYVRHFNQPYSKDGVIATDDDSEVEISNLARSLGVVQYPHVSGDGASVGDHAAQESPPRHPGTSG